MLVGFIFFPPVRERAQRSDPAAVERLSTERMRRLDTRPPQPVQVTRERRATYLQSMRKEEYITRNEPEPLTSNITTPISLLALNLNRLII